MMKLIKELLNSAHPHSPIDCDGVQLSLVIEMNGP